jgi:hypothetical protein
LPFLTAARDFALAFFADLVTADLADFFLATFAGRFLAKFEAASFDDRPDFPPCFDAAAGFSAVFEPWKIRSHPEENLIEVPVWTV